MKVVINKCYGGFSISPEAALWLFERGFNENEFKIPVNEYWKGEDNYDKDSVLGKEKALNDWREHLSSKGDSSRRISCFLRVFTPDERFVLSTRPESRTDPLLVECVETLGKEANGSFSKLAVVEIPDDVKFYIHEYDGFESINEKHRSWE